MTSTIQPEVVEYRPRGHVIDHTGSWLKAAASICSTTTLPPLLALPSALAALQWPAGIPILLFCSIGTFYCLWLLVQVTEAEILQGKRYDTYPGLAVAITGKKYWGTVVLILQVSFNWGTGVAATIMSASFINNIFVIKCTESCNEMGVATWTLVAAGAATTLVLLPDFSNRNLLIITSGSFTFIYSTIAIVLSFLNNKHDQARFDLTGSTETIFFNALNALGVMYFLYGDTEYPELQSYLKPDENRSTAKSMSRGMYSAFSVVIPMLALVGVSGYWGFGNAVSPILFSADWKPVWLVDAAVVMCIVQLLFSIQMFGQPIYQKVEPFIMKKFPKCKWMQHRIELEYEVGDMEVDIYGHTLLSPSRKRYYDAALPGEMRKKIIIVPSYLLMTIQRLLYMASIALVAVIFNFFLAFIGVIGAIGITPLTFLFPLAFHMIVHKENMSTFSKYFHSALFVLYLLGGILALIGAFYNIVVSFGSFKLVA